MKELLQKVLELAKYNLARDKYLSETALVFKNNILISGILIKIDSTCSYDSRTEALVKVGAYARGADADLVVLVNDAAMRSVPEGSETVDETEMPLAYPKSMRTECIVITGIQVPEGEETILFQAYKGGDGEDVEFIPYDVPADGKYTTRFTEVIRTGWATMDTIIKKGIK